MKIILLKDVAKLGKRYETKTVSDGHALNLLIPQGLAIVATRDAIKRIEVLKKRLEGEMKVQDELFSQNIKALENVGLVIMGKANEQGHLFAGLHAEDIARELAAQAHIQISPALIQLEHPIKEVGEHMIKVHAAGKSAHFKVEVKKG